LVAAEPKGSMSATSTALEAAKISIACLGACAIVNGEECTATSESVSDDLPV
jgi:hypothetical protein